MGHVQYDIDNDVARYSVLTTNHAVGVSQSMVE